MKVLQIVSISFSLKYFIGNQFVFFKKKGVEYTVVCSPSEDLSDYSSKMGFETFPLTVSRNISPIQDLISIFKLYRFIKKNKFDIVISHSPKGGLIGMLASYLAKSPKRVFFRHGLVFETSQGLKRKLLIYIEKITSFCAHTVVNVSPSVLENSINYNLNSPKKNIMLGKGTCNGIDTLKFFPNYNKKSNKTVIGFVGRLSNDKGITELVNAWEKLLKKYNNIELLLVGPIDERDGLILETKYKIKNLPNIRVLGEVENTAPLYHEMDIFILPSYREGFPTVVLEASSSGLPVITTRSTGCIDSIIENFTGIFSEINENSISEKIGFYIENSEVAKQHGINGRKFVENNFSEQLIYKEIENKILS